MTSRDIFVSRHLHQAETAGSPAVNGQPMTLVEFVDHEAMAYRAWKTPEGDFLADQMERLAQLVRWTGASTGQEHLDRMEVWDRKIRDEHYDRGWNDALDQAKLVILHSR